MDINRFTAALISRLESAGADRRDATACARAFVSSMSEDEAEKLSSLVDNDDVMSKVTSSLMSRIEAAAASRAAAQSAQSDCIDDEDDDSIDEMLAHSDPRRDGAPKVRPRGEQAAYAQPPRRNDRPARPQQPGPNGRPVQQMHPHRTGDMRPRQVAELQPRRQTPGRQGRPAPKQDAGKKWLERRPIYKPDPNADYQKFYIILACSSPLWGLALLLGAAAFVFAIGALSVSIVLLIVGLFAGVAVGTILALVGIIYGITQLFEYVPIGTYEIGLGIMIGGAVMFFGVLAYNIAVRLLPYVIKQVMVLLSFTIHKCVELYYYAKGRCADL